MFVLLVLSRDRVTVHTAARTCGCGGLFVGVAASILNMFMSPEGQAKLNSNPETAAYMKDPQFMQMLQMCQQNPQMINM